MYVFVKDQKYLQKNKIFIVFQTKIFITQFTSWEIFTEKQDLYCLSNKDIYHPIYFMGNIYRKTRSLLSFKQRYLSPNLLHGKYLQKNKIFIVFQTKIFITQFTSWEIFTEKQDLYCLSNKDIYHPIYFMGNIYRKTRSLLSFKQRYLSPNLLHGKYLQKNKIFIVFQTKIFITQFTSWEIFTEKQDLYCLSNKDIYHPIYFMGNIYRKARSLLSFKQRYLSPNLLHGKYLQKNKIFIVFQTKIFITQLVFRLSD